MDPLTEKIITAHAEHGVAGTGSDPGYRALAEQHAGDTGFDAIANRVSDVAGKLERTLEGQTHRDQVEFALKLFYGSRKRKERQKICGALIRRRYARYWSDEQRKYFEEASEKLGSWRDYFLSFTNYNPTAGEVMFVNREHRELIRVGLDQYFKPPETKDENLLARVLDYELSNVPLKGFFYPKHRGAADVEECLRREARESFVFVQLIQNSMFEKWPNYCLEEFAAASKDGSRRLIFVMTVPFQEFIEPESVDERMHDWHDAIRKPDVVELPPASTRADARTLLGKIRRRVVEPVRAARSELFRGVPE